MKTKQQKGSPPELQDSAILISFAFDFSHTRLFVLLDSLCSVLLCSAASHSERPPQPRTHALTHSPLTQCSVRTRTHERCERTRENHQKALPKGHLFSLSRACCTFTLPSPQPRALACLPHLTFHDLPNSKPTGVANRLLPIYWLYTRLTSGAQICYL